MLLEFILIFIVTLVLIKLIIKYAVPLGLVDVPNERSMHAYSRPCGAGIGIFLGVMILGFGFDFTLFVDHYLTYLAILLVFIVGVLDDHQETSPNTKFFVIALSALMAYYDGIYVSSLGHLFGFNIYFGWFALPFTVFSIVGYTNALNLIDGLDGLAGLISIVIFTAFFSIGYSYDDIYIMVTAGSFIAGISAFLVYNWNPASVFMGDSGSLVLGFVICLLAIKSIDYIQPVTVLFILAVPLMDTLIVMVRRKRQGRSMFQADKTHIHHVLFNLFDKDVKRTVIILVILQAVYSITGLLLVEYANQSMSLVLFCMNVVLLYYILTEMLRRQIEHGIAT